MSPDRQDERRALADDHARAWLHAYGIRTERYTAGGDHPAMDTLPEAMLAFADALCAPTPDAAWRGGAEAAITADQARLILSILEPLRRADAAIGDEPGPFRFETGSGYRDLSREDLRAAGKACRILSRALPAAAPASPEAGEPGGVTGGARG